MKLIMENWRKYLIENEEKQGRGMKLLMENWQEDLEDYERWKSFEELAKLQKWTEEQTIARLVIGEDWEEAFKRLEAKKDKLKLYALIQEIVRLLGEEKERLGSEKKYRETDVRWWAKRGKGSYAPHGLPKAMRKLPPDYKIPIEDPKQALDNIYKSVFNFVTGGKPQKITELPDGGLLYLLNAALQKFVLDGWGIVGTWEQSRRDWHENPRNLGLSGQPEYSRGYE